MLILKGKENGKEYIENQDPVNFNEEINALK
jgi:hypothetical protein